jgi:hypothetical protein
MSKSKSKSTPELIAEARVALSTLELMTSKTWVGDPEYPNQIAKRLQTIAHTLQQRTVPAVFFVTPPTA